MAATLLELADEVVTQLTALTNLNGGTIERQWVPKKEPKDVKELYVTVVAIGQERSRGARQVWDRQQTVNVALQKRVATDADTDAMLLLLEQYADELERLAAVDRTWMVLTVKAKPVYSPEHLYEFKVFTGVIEVVFLQRKGLA